MKDVDHAEVAFRLRTGAYAAVALILATVGGLVLRMPILLALLAGAGIACIVYFGTLAIADSSGRIGASIYQPSGSSTPPVRQYSLADSLAARGKFEEAAEAYRLLADDFPDDPEPRMRHARLLRDNTVRYEEAGTIFKSILSMRALKKETELIVLRELVELHMFKQREPTRALPYLVRIVQKYGDTATGQWARQEVRDIKQQMQSEHDRDAGERA